MLILGGLLAVWIGPEVGGEREHGSPGPVRPQERFWMRAFGVGCVICGAILLIATLLGFRAPGAEGPPIP